MIDLVFYIKIKCPGKEYTHYYEFKITKMATWLMQNFKTQLLLEVLFYKTNIVSTYIYIFIFTYSYLHIHIHYIHIYIYAQL